MFNPDYSFCVAWPDELKEIEKKRYRLCCKARCLETNIERADYDDFDALMNELEKVNGEIQQISIQRLVLLQKYGGESK